MNQKKKSLTKQPCKIDLDKIKKKIPPKIFNEMLGCLELRDIYLKNLNSSLFVDKYSLSSTSKHRLDFSESGNLINLTDDYASLEVDYKLIAKSGTKKLFEVIAKYAVVFDLSGKLPKEFFELYKSYSLPLQTYPYLRELANSIISRMGFPPLILPLRKNLIGKQNT